MSLRDFNSSTDERPVILNHEPLGNGAGLGAFHTVNPEDREPNNTPKILGALAVALMVGAAGAYVYSVSGKSMEPRPVTTAANTPAPAPMAPPAAQPAADTMTPPAADTTPVSTPEPVAKPAPVKSASAKPVARTASSTRMAATQQPTAAIPEPVSPAPSPSDIASNTPSGATAAVPATPARIARRCRTARLPSRNLRPRTRRPAPLRNRLPSLLRPRFSNTEASTTSAAPQASGARFFFMKASNAAQNWAR